MDRKMTENIIQASVSQEMIDISAYQQEAGKNGHRTMQVNFLRYEADDNGNAETMRDLYGEKFLYSPALGWLQYTGTHYEQIPEEVTMSYASETLRLRRHAAVDAKNETLIKAAKQSAYNIHACVQMFRPYVIVTDI